ncbi:winged helix-turn-helix domain-containing protein [uncultured Roseobacter sp.]|uniref:winged helix-turn-helix domain-containing protein n=1 Tax=uncultured Roseobacter sp. TaxID=114847 RepID=UPI0026056AB8|nr:winged helix-turn-helix domain-containing protein [uncultured Roseobacter sp.]
MLTDGHQEFTVSPRAIGVLAMLCDAGTRTVTRDALLDAVWPNVAVTDESLTQAVAKLRRVFGGTNAGDDLIVTVPKRGYRLSVDPLPCEVRRDSLQGASPTISMDAYCLVLQAHTALVRADEDALELALAFASEAVARSPQSPLAHATYSVILTHVALYGGGTMDLLQLARQHADTAAALGARSSIGNVALGFAIGAADGAGKAFEWLTRGLMLNDLNGEGHYLAARVAFISGDHRAAAALAMQSAELVADTPRPLFLAARSAQHFDVTFSKTIADRCVRALNRRLETDPDEPRSRHTLGPALAFAGHCEDAWNTIVEQPRGKSICAVHDTFGLAQIGDRRRALESLERAMDEGFRHGTWLTREPMMPASRTTPNSLGLRGQYLADCNGSAHTGNRPSRDTPRCGFPRADLREQRSATWLRQQFRAFSMQWPLEYSFTGLTQYTMMSRRSDISFRNNTLRARSSVRATGLST